MASFNTWGSTFDGCDVKVFDTLRFISCPDCDEHTDMRIGRWDDGYKIFCPNCGAGSKSPGSATQIEALEKWLADHPGYKVVPR